MIELAGIIILGIFAQWLAWRFSVPAILPLIITGLIVGPLSTLYTVDGHKLIEPIWNGQYGLFPGENLFNFVELAIGIILFEGGLTLKQSELRGVGSTILKLISLGALITFIGAGIITHFLIGLNWSISFLFAGLIIVTGPTVIAPILRNIPLKRNVSTVLKWEGILIDPIGALVAVLVYEFIISSGSGGEFTVHALVQFLRIVFIGFSLGFGLAHLLRYLLIKNWIPHYLLTIFTLAYVLLVFVGSDFIVHDSGLLTVVVTGTILGNTNVPKIEEIAYFKESLSVLLISILFILLSANITMEDLYLINNWRCYLLFALIVLFLRPLSVFSSTQNSNLDTNEKLFISWVGPRGIVAAGIASLFGLKLSKQGYDGARYITPLVFMVVLGTVLLNATTAKVMSKLLKVHLTRSFGILIVGAHRASRLIARYLQDNDQHVVLIDSNQNNIETATNEGLLGFIVNIYQDNLRDNLELNDVGYLLALTGSIEVNEYVIEKYASIYGEHGAYRLISSDEMRHRRPVSEHALFSKDDDYLNMMRVSLDYPQIHEVAISNAVEYNNLIEKCLDAEESIPLFVKNAEGNFQVIKLDGNNFSFGEKSKFVYLGKSLESEDNQPLTKAESVR